MQLKTHTQNADIALYELEKTGSTERYILSTPETRAICNDPFVLGIDYTQKLQTACAKALKALGAPCTETQALVLNILRGGLNFGLREALATAHNWNRPTSAFISSQRACDEDGNWHITENRYQKVYVPEQAHIFCGDVVATGVSLEHALQKILELAREQEQEVSGLTFFTIGGPRTEEILAKLPVPTRVIYIEGIFKVADEKESLQIALPGTDLLRNPSLLAPEFAKSQAENPAYPLERCTIYDAGSRAFHVSEYLEDVHDYWQQVLTLAQNGLSYADYLAERMGQNSGLSTDHDLIEIAKKQLQKN